MRDALAPLMRATVEADSADVIIIGMQESSAPAPDALTQDHAPLTAAAAHTDLTQRPLLRFITCGSVDDGKSTLIGRVLYDAHAVLDDQIATLQSDSKRFGTQGEAMDFALLVDGLAAEREQGITIDVAYRYFATARRKFIVADTPGHEQYTRNMATGASTADLAIILVDARKGVLPQTRRHSFIVSMLGVKQVVVAVNKMDLVAYSPVIFGRIEGEYRAFAAALGFTDITVIPVAAIEGVNVSSRGSQTPWYDGPTLIEHLESVDIAPVAASSAFRMPVQWVNRPDASFRGFSGLIAEGVVRIGDRIRTLPSGKSATVARILGGDGDLDTGIAGQSVTLTLTKEIDISRGDVLSDARRPAPVGDLVDARLLWMAEDALVPERAYLMKIGAATVTAIVEAPRHRIDITTLKTVAAPTLRLNEIGSVRLRLDRPLAMERYADLRALGGFILIDRITFDTLAMGLVDQVSLSETQASPDTTDSYAGMEGLARASADQAGAPEQPKNMIHFKAMSWAATSLGTLAVAYVLTRDTALSLTLAIADGALKLGLYSVHERLWSRVAHRQSSSGKLHARPHDPAKSPDTAGDGI